LKKANSKREGKRGGHGEKGLKIISSSGSMRKRAWRRKKGAVRVNASGNQISELGEIWRRGGKSSDNEKDIE